MGRTQHTNEKQMLHSVTQHMQLSVLMFYIYAI